MIKFSVTSEPDFPLTPEAIDWLVNAHLPVQFDKAMSLIEFERKTRGARFDPNARANMIGRVNIHLHSRDWIHRTGQWIAGVYTINGGTWTPEDGVYFVDLIECSWLHEYSMGWDTLEHEFAHMMQYRMPAGGDTDSEDWQYMGHGIWDKDPYVRAINQKIMEAYPRDQAYHPGFIGTATKSSLSQYPQIGSCGTGK